MQAQVRVGGLSARSMAKAIEGTPSQAVDRGLVGLRGISGMLLAARQRSSEPLRRTVSISSLFVRQPAARGAPAGSGGRTRRLGMSARTAASRCNAASGSVATTMASKMTKVSNAQSTPRSQFAPPSSICVDGQR